MVNKFFALFILIGGLISYAIFTASFPETQRGFGFLEPFSPVMERIIDLHDLMLWVVFGIPIFVLAVLAYIMVRFSKKNNPVASKCTHNTTLEIIWTVIPIIILVIICIPSIKLLYYMDKTVDAEMTLKVTGYQWYWGYEYPDHGNISFESILIPDEELQDGQIRLLETDNRVVLPINTNIRLLFASADVIHAWAVPKLGVKIDTVPGKLNESWVRIDKPGIYRGQCSELCGVNHAYMPIVIEAVSKEDFIKWTKKAEQEFSKVTTPLTLASN